MDENAGGLSANRQSTEKREESRSSGQGRCQGIDSVESESQVACGCSDSVGTAGSALGFASILIHNFLVLRRPLSKAREARITGYSSDEQRSGAGCMGD